MKDQNEFSIINFLKLKLSACIAGMLISIGAFCNIYIGKPLGPFLFAFGLLGVISYGFHLFTGQYGFVNKIDKRFYPKWYYIFNILLYNALGTLIVAAIVPDIDMQIVNSIIESRQNQPWHQLIFSGILCGIIMSVAVKSAKKKNWWPLIFGIPLFIYCGFAHSIADQFYINYFEIHGGDASHWNLWWPYVALGNVIGCALPELAQKFLKSEQD